MAGLGLDPDGPHDLLDVVRAFRPNVLLGTTAHAGTFTEAVIRSIGDTSTGP